MDGNRATTLAVLLAALLHLGLIAFLFLATLSCATWEHLVDSLGLPARFNPVSCQRPASVPGQVIEATLVGPTAAPRPVGSRHRSPPPPPPAPKVPTPKPPVKTLPPPPKHPDIKDQQQVVREARQATEQARKVQQQREKQHMSELSEQHDMSKIDKLFKQMDQARHEASRAARQADLEAQRQAQVKDLKQAAHAHPDVARGAQARSGTAGQNDSLTGQYLAAVKSAVTQAWLRPDNIPAGVVCKIDITQIPGGQVISAHVEASCPYDTAGRRSVENAVLRAQPLPYKGYEKVFQRQLTLNFKVDH